MAYFYFLPIDGQNRFTQCLSGRLFFREYLVDVIDITHFDKVKAGVAIRIGNDPVDLDIRQFFTCQQEIVFLWCQDEQGIIVQRQFLDDVPSNTAHLDG